VKHSMTVVQPSVRRQGRARLQFGMRGLLLGIAMVAILAALSRKEPDPKPEPIVRVSKMVVNERKLLSYDLKLSDGTTEMYSDIVSTGPALNEVILFNPRRHFFDDKREGAFSNVTDDRRITPAMDARFDRLRRYIAARADIDALEWVDVLQLNSVTKERTSVVVPLTKEFDRWMIETRNQTFGKSKPAGSGTAPPQTGASGGGRVEGAAHSLDFPRGSS
jgi:hypothetical protein